MNKTAKVFLGVAALILIPGFVVWKYHCVATRGLSSCPPPVANREILEEINKLNKHSVDTAISMLRQGYIVIRRGLGADSYMLAEMNRRDKTYSHCGIVMIENGYPFVYHSIGGEDNPDERLRRDSANFFFSPERNTHIGVVRYDFDSIAISSLRDIVTDIYKERPKFDLKFDLSTDERLYCSEFVYKAIARATRDTAYIPRSILLGKRIVGIDDLFMNDHATFIWQIKFK